MRDDVHAIHSPYWPVEAYEWISRQRLHGLPSKSTIREVVKYGCDFVQVSHKSVNRDPAEWRFSFSRAELIIISSWTAYWRIIYRTIHALYKIIKSRMDDSALCTYYFKTLMLWMAEVKPNLQSQDLLFYYVCEILCELVNWLRVGFCPNYFIPSNNMIDHLTYNDLSADIDALCQLLQTRELIADVLHTSTAVEMFTANMIFCMELPMWICTSVVFYNQINNIEDNFTNLYPMCSLVEPNRAAKIELFDLYKILKLTAAHRNSYSIKDKYTLRGAVYQLTACTKTWDSVKLNCSRFIFDLLSNMFMQYETESSESHLSTCKMMHNDDQLNSLQDSNAETVQKCLLYSQSMDHLGIIMGIDQVNDDQQKEKSIRLL